MKLSQRLQNIADGVYFDGEALRLAYELEHSTTSNDRQMLSRYMHGAEVSSDRFRLQDLIVELSSKGL